MIIQGKIIKIIVCLFVSLALISLTAAYSSAQSMANEEKQQWPKTVKEAVAKILSGMSDKDKEIIKNTKKEDLIKFHHGWGTGIRNEFGLWRGNKALMDDTKTKHPDEASMVIIEAVWQELQKQKLGNK